MDRSSAPAPRPQIAIPSHGRHRILQGDTCAVEPERESGRWRYRLSIAAAFAIALAGLVLWFVTAQPDATALLRLPPADRSDLVERTLSNIHAVCRGNERPREFCRQQADLLLKLPECGPACRADARELLMADSAVR